MGWASPDVYNQPDRFDLEPFGGLDESGLSYEFHMLDVWRHKKTNELYWAEDSGCSCPSPYEDYTSLDMLEKITVDNLSDFTRIVTLFPDDEYDKLMLIAKVTKHLKDTYDTV